MGPEWYDKSVLILGCGNVLFGDDGFGPAIAVQSFLLAICFRGGQLQYKKYGAGVKRISPKDDPDFV